MTEHVFTGIYFVAIGSFFAIIADPTIGGTYMSLLWAAANFSMNLWISLVTWLVGILDPNETEGEISTNHDLNQVNYILKFILYETRFF